MIVETVTLGVTLFVTTNVDDLVLLVGWFADPATRHREVYAGQLIGIGAITAVAAVAAAAAFAVPVAWVGLLGLVPLALGTAGIVRLVRGGVAAAEAAEAEEVAEAADALAAPTRWRRVLAVAGVTMANGGDNIAVYVPVFRQRTGAGIMTIAAVFLAITVLWCLAAEGLVGTKRGGAFLRHWSPRVLPFVLVALGCWVLWSSRSWTLLTA